jgi:hypothetical protein
MIAYVYIDDIVVSYSESDLVSLVNNRTITVHVILPERSFKFSIRFGIQYNSFIELLAVVNLLLLHPQNGE